MAIIISMFNHKGGVSKTTSAFHLAWMLSELGKKVLLVDADPQCNLSGLIMDFGGPEAFEGFYKENPRKNVMIGLTPAFEAQPKLVEGVEPVPVSGREGLYLLPGHLRLSEYETTLTLAHTLSDAILPLKNVPGSIHYMFRKTAELVAAEVVIVDMNPSLSAINQNILMTSNFFLIPTSPDYFSIMALNSLATVIPRWADWYTKARQHPILSESVYPLPQTLPKLLGTVIQNYRPRDGRPTAAFRPWIDQIKDRFRKKEDTKKLEGSKTLFSVLQEKELTLPDVKYGNLLDVGLALAEVPNFNSLVARSQEHRKPVFALTSQDVGQMGKVRDTTESSIENFRRIYSGLAKNVIDLTGIK